MNEINVLSLPFYEFTASEELTNSVLDDVKKEKFYKSASSPNTFTDFYYHSKMFDFLDECLMQIKSKYLLPELNLPIISCWATKTIKLQSHYYHNHRNSLVSGIFYLTSHDSGNTFFAIEDPWYKHILSNLKFSNNTGLGLQEELPQLVGKIKPIKGKVILFPSHIKHKVTPLISDEERYIIAFNAFPSGVMGKDNSSVYLNLNTQSVREMFERDKK